MPRTPRRGCDANLDDWNITDCLRILWRHKGPLLWITLIGGLTAATLTWAQPRVYQSRALVEVPILNENFLNLRTIYPAVASKIDPGLYLQTQVELFQQDSLIKEVARKLHLEKRREYQPAPMLLGKLRDDIRIVPLRNTRIIEVVCDALDPSLAADLANTLARTFIEQSVESRQRSGRRTYESLQLELALLRQRLRHQAADESTPSGLRQVRGLLIPDVRVNQYVYKTMLREANDARTASVVRQSSVELIAPAQPPIRPNRPNFPLNLAIGIFDGFVLAVAFVMLHEQGESVLRAPGDAESFLGLPELGAIPRACTRKPSPLGFLARGREEPCVAKAVLEHRSSRLSESVRGALTSILSSNRDHPRVVVVTSSLPQEGKTTMVSILGFALAEIGWKTLLIDRDSRHPQLDGIFDHPDVCQLSEISGNPNVMELPLEALIKRTAIPHLFLLSCGTYTDAIWDFRNSDRTALWFQRFREQFDYVLVDTPPCYEFTAARNLAPYADGLVLVVRANSTSRWTARAAAARFESHGFRVMGTILNRWNPSRRDRWLPPFGTREAGWIGGL
jgi:polysaccharide biosynthesis transport protein